ncbi:MAG: MMPL family transporter [Spirochaetes bacterium]|nr:MMPL family transporter [Spirochaetota bacterium]
MRKKFSDRLARILFKRAGMVAAIIAAAIVLSVWASSRLETNYNQLDLLPQNLPSVKATNQLIKMVGGVGYFIVGLKGNDEAHLKKVADDLTERFLKVPGVMNAQCRLDLDFVEQHLPYFIETSDLEEILRRVRKAIRAAVREQTGLGFSVSGEKETIGFQDIIEKYEGLDKRGIDDPYFIDKSRKMLIIMVQPKGNPGDILFSENLVANIQAVIDDYNKNNTVNAVLKEKYRDLADGATVTYGFTGDYKNNIDDARIVERALLPTSVFAFVGILLCLVFLLRNPLQIVFLMFTLVASVIMTYAFCKITTGELNTITVILGAIIMGFGIDFGLYFIYRLREEFTATRDLQASIASTLLHAGTSSVISAFISACSFFILTLSDFRGFSDFGLMAGGGVLITAVMMYFTLPVIYVLIERYRPGFSNSLVTPVFSGEKEAEAVSQKPFPYAGKILASSLVLTVVLSFFAYRIAFDYDGRSFMTADSPSVILQEEITDRFGIASDPAVIYTPDIDEARKVYDALVPLPEGSSVDSVLSIHTLVPSMEKQLANIEVLKEIKSKIANIPPDMLDNDSKQAAAMIDRFLKMPTFTMADVPQSLISQFRPVIGSGFENGYLTFIYPGVSVWDGRELIRFSDEVGSVRAGDKTYYTAGGAVLFADLARIVLADGKKFSLLIVMLVIIILAAAFRNVRAVLFSIIPLLGGMVWMLGLMAMFGWKINFVNIVVFPVVFGYGVSLGVYLYRRYMESGSVMLSVRRTGMAIAGSSVTTLIGWAALLVSGHNGLESMGILAFFGIAAAMFLTFTILPALLEITGGKNSRSGR